MQWTVFCFQVNRFEPHYISNDKDTFWGIVNLFEFWQSFKIKLLALPRCQGKIFSKPYFIEPHGKEMLDLFSN